MEFIHPMKVPLGTPCTHYFSLSAVTWLKMKTIKRGGGMQDLTHMINARNFLVDVMVNAMHQIDFDFISNSNRFAQKELVLLALNNQIVGLTVAINDELRYLKIDPKAERSGQGHNLKWSYKYSEDEADKMAHRHKYLVWLVNEAKQVIADSEKPKSEKKKPKGKSATA